MHLTLKTEATKPAAANVLQQQARFDAFVERYNNARPHQALGMKSPRRRLRAFPARLPRPAGARLSLSRPHHRRHPLWPDLLQPPESESQPRLRRPERRRHAGRPAHLAPDLHALRFGLLRRRDVPTRTDRQPLRPESVTHVFGMNCYPCVRNGPNKRGAGGGS